MNEGSAIFADVCVPRLLSGSLLFFNRPFLIPNNALENSAMIDIAYDNAPVATKRVDWQLPKVWVCRSFSASSSPATPGSSAAMLYLCPELWRILRCSYLKGALEGFLPLLRDTSLTSGCQNFAQVISRRSLSYIHSLCALDRR